MSDNQPVNEDLLVDITRRMYRDSMLLSDSGHPYFSVRGRDLLASLHHMLLSQDPSHELERLVDRI